MEPLDEDGLKQLLRKWEAPPAPATLKERLFPQRPWWRWLFTGTIRVPVPVALAVVIVFALWIQLSRPARTTPATQPGTVSLADFQPVQQLQPVVVVGGQK